MFSMANYNCSANTTHWSTGNNCPAGYPCVNGRCELVPRQDRSVQIQCVCSVGWTGQACSQCCDLPCVNGTCVVRHGRQRCQCAWHHTGPLCDAFAPHNFSMSAVGTTRSIHVIPFWYWYLIGCCVAIAVIFVAVMATVPWYMWKRRFPLILHFIHHLQRFQDEDKLFDAFLSYRGCGEDENFVMNTLYPKLEKEHNFKLCLHSRDFVPGETIANNILWAITNSRRTILVLSPSFVAGEWTRFEYQIAQHEMLKLRHKILPIVFKGISDVPDIDQNLIFILQSVTYLIWPHNADKQQKEKFWKRLIFSLPRKRHLVEKVVSKISTIRSENNTRFPPTEDIVNQNNNTDECYTYL